MVRLISFITMFTAVQVFAKYSDSAYKIKRKEFIKYANLFNSHYYDDILNNEKALYYLEKLDTKLDALLHFPQSFSDKFPKIEILEVNYNHNKKFRIFTFSNSPGGNWQTATTYVQWIKVDSSMGIQKMISEGDDVKLNQLNDSLYLHTDGIFMEGSYHRFLNMLKFKNDTFIIVYNAFSHHYFNKHFPCKIHRIDSWGIACEEYVEEMYNPRTHKITIEDICFGEESCADENCNTYRILYYIFVEDRFILRSKIYKKKA